MKFESTTERTAKILAETVSDGNLKTEQRRKSEAPRSSKDVIKLHSKSPNTIGRKISERSIQSGNSRNRNSRVSFTFLNSSEHLNNFIR
jgi:polyhydroxyalkanoate synthesis regulator phasin